MTSKNKTALEEASEKRAEPHEALDAVILYDTIPAGKRGLSILSGITGVLEDDLVEVRPRPWRLDLLEDPSAVETATHEISTAHVIILSTSGSAPLPFAFKIWLATILAQRQRSGERVAVVALLGLDEMTTQTASDDLRFIKQLTLEAELDFFAPWFNGQNPMAVDCEMGAAVENDADALDENSHPVPKPPRPSRASGDSA
jgi:hypothetical protein